MTKEQLMLLIDNYDDDEEIDLNELTREFEEEKERRIEELEERQHQSGFYAFQDLMDMWRRER